MNHLYETLVLLSPELGEDGRAAIYETLTGVIENNGGTLQETDEWGMKTLAYPVRKQTRGFYVRFVYTGPGPIVAELERNIRIAKDEIFKFVTVNLADQAAAEA